MSDFVRRKRKHITLEMKRTLITEFQNGLNAKAVSRKYNMPYTTVVHIIDSKERILRALQSHPKTATCVRGSIVIQKKMEMLLKSWCETELKHGRLSVKDVQSKAMEIFDKLKLKNNIPPDKMVYFDPSANWYKRFQSRCSDLPWDKVSAKPGSGFIDELRRLVEKDGYCDQTVFNVCESTLYWKRFPKIDDLQSKDMLGLILGANAAGDCKLKPVVVYHSENPEALKNKSKGDVPVIWKTNPECSITASLFEDWLRHHFLPEVERFCYSQNIPLKVLLILRSDNCHPNMSLVNFDPRVKVMYLPENAVSYQPMDQGIITTFKAIYIKQLLEMTVQYNTNFNVSWNALNILDAVRAIGESWNEVSKTIFSVSWKELYPAFSQSSFLSTNGQIEETVSDIADLAKKLGLDLNSDDITAFLNGPVQKIEPEQESDETSLSCSILSTDIITDDEPEKKEKAVAVERLVEGLDLIENGLRIFKEIDANEERVNAVRQGVQKAIACYTEMMQQKTEETAEIKPTHS